MTKAFQTAYIPFAVGTFHMESARRLFNESVELLKQTEENTIVPEDLILSTDALEAYLDTVDPDLLVIQNLTFANGQYASEVMHRFKDVPVLLWTLREPVIDGTRLRLNALTGAYSAANAIRAFKKEPFEFVYGSPDEEAVIAKIHQTVHAARIRYEMKTLRTASIGHTPQGFGFGRPLDLDLLEKFGVHHEAIEARELIDLAKSYTDEECEAWLKDAMDRTVGLQNTPERNRLDFARLYKAYDTWTKEHHIGALASCCWPDFFTSFGTPVCAVLAMLNDLGVTAACEADLYGAVSMWIAQRLSQEAVFFGDPVSLNEKENTITFWHCGTAACSLAREDTGAVIGEHCNRHIGPTMEFGCRESGHAVIFRIGRNPDGTFRFLIVRGKALDRPKQFYGTSVVIETEGCAETVIHETVEAGWEPHYAVAFADIAEELKILAHMFNCEVTEYK